jgi:hypothetical protein
LWRERFHQRTKITASFDTGATNAETTGDQLEIAIDRNNTEMDVEDGDDGDNIDFTQDSQAVYTQESARTDEHNFKLTLNDLFRVGNKTASAIFKTRNKQLRDKLSGTFVKLMEIANGNGNVASTMSALDVLENHLNRYACNMPSQSMFTQDASGDKENAAPAEALLMDSGAPAGSGGGNRKRGYQERQMNAMKDARRREKTCTLCCNPGHNVGRNCPIIVKYSATSIKGAEVSRFAARLGNPNFILVEEPDRETRASIREWTAKVQEIPTSTRHVLLTRCFYSALKDESFQNNVLEVILFEKGGLEIENCNPAYYPVHQVQPWVIQNCSAVRRKRVLLSSIEEPLRRAGLYDYSPDNKN